MNQRNGSVDLFRFLAACLVFVSHSIYSDYPSLLAFLGIIGRWALPFFFLVSGYYFQKSYAARSTEAFAKTVKALLPIILFVNLLYLIFVEFTEGTIQPLLNHFTLLVGTYFHLWFLTSLTISYLVLWFFLNYKLEKLLPFLIVVTFVLILLFTPYNFLFGIKPHPIYARSLLSIPFLSMGYLISKQERETQTTGLTSFWLIVAGVGIQLLEGWFLRVNGHDSSRVNFLAGTPLISIGMFLLSLKLPVSSNNLLSHYGRRYSLQLYLYHPIVNYCLHKLVVNTGIGGIIYWTSPLLGLGFLLLILIYLDKFTPALFRILSGNLSITKRQERPKLSEPER